MGLDSGWIRILCDYSHCPETIMCKSGQFKDGVLEPIPPMRALAVAITDGWTLEVETQKWFCPRHGDGERGIDPVPKTNERQRA